MKKITKILVSSIGLIWSTPALAASVNIIPYNDGDLTTYVTSIIVKIVTLILGFAGALATLMIIYSGILLMTAGANAERQQSAKKTLTYAIYGIIIVIIAFAAVFAIATAVQQVANKASV